MDNFEEYVGLTEDQLRGKLATAGKHYRVVYRDGEYFVVTMDFQIARLNVGIENSIITFVNGWG